MVCKKSGKQVYKPGSVEGSHLSRRKVAFSLKRPYPGARRAASQPPYLVLLLAGFAWPAGRPTAGSLLHYLFTLTQTSAVQPFKAHEHLFEVMEALVEGGMSLWHFP